MSTRTVPQVHGPIQQRRPNPSPQSSSKPEANPRRRRRRRRNPKNPKITYVQGAGIGMVLGAIGVAISSAAEAPMPVVTTSAGTFAVPAESSAMRATKGAIRGGLLGLAVGLAATFVAKELKVGSVGKMMNPAGPGTALILGSTIGATALGLDAGLKRAMS